MAKQLQIRGGTTAQHSTFTGAIREITVDTDKDTLVVHDGATAGGFPLARESVVNASFDTKVDKNADIVAGIGTKVTYDRKGLVTGSTTLSASDIPSLDASKITTGTLSLDTTGSAAKITTARNIAITGDITWSTSFDGSANVTGVGTLANSGVTAGTYKSVTVDSKGRVTNGTNPTTVNEYGITDVYTKTESDANIALESTNRTNADNALQTSINVERARVDAIIEGAGANADNFAEIVTLINSVDTTNDQAFAGYVLSNDTRSTNIENSVTTKVTKNSDITAGSNTKITYDAKGLVTGGSTPTTLAGYSIADAYTKTESDASLALKVDDTEVASVNLFRADKYLAAQNVVKMVYDVNKKLTKVQYNNATDVDYEVLSYTNGKLTNVAHYVGGVLKGNTVLTYVNGLLNDAPFVAV